VPEKSGQDIDPRPPYRVRSPILYQSWNASTWLHWPYDPDVVQARLPDGLEVDTFEGTAWVGLVPFIIENQRVPGMPALPWISTAQETHIRTYVTGPDGRGGAYFLYLENDRLPGVITGRAAFFLKYVWASMSIERRDDVVAYRGRRLLPPGASHEIEVETGRPYAEPELGNLDLFVTAQWILFTKYGPRLAAVPVEHPPWPLRRAELRTLRIEGVFESAGLPPPEGDPLVHYSPGVDSRIGFPRLVR
jgi:uncharacterized protein